MLDEYSRFYHINIYAKKNNWLIHNLIAMHFDDIPKGYLQGEFTYTITPDFSLNWYDFDNYDNRIARGVEEE